MATFGPIIAFLLTIMVFSYIFGDNLFFRLASHIFVGVAVGYAIVVIWRQVFIPAIGSGDPLLVIPALVLCLLLVFKIRPVQGGGTNALGSIALAFILGVGVALAIGGVLFGTLAPQVAAMFAISLNFNDYPDPESQVRWLNNIIIVLGTLGTFFYFTFTVRAQGILGGVREVFVRFFAGMGRLVIIFTLGALFANTVSARVALLISRLQFLADFLGGR